MYNVSVDELMKDAQSAYADDLMIKTEKINKLLQFCKGGCSKHDSNRILRFFHSVNGTAFTLGFNRLGRIGRTWEKRIKDAMKRECTLRGPILDEIIDAIKDIKNEVSTMGETVGGCDHFSPLDDYINMTDRGRILLVDDDITILKLLEDALTGEGYTVYISDDPEMVPNLISSLRPDIVILDIVMPRVDGYELLEKIKTDDEHYDMYIFFLSAVGGIEDRIKGMRAGADDYITKPFIIDEVIAKIETALRRENKYREKLIKDSLTDVYSRCCFNQRIAEEIERYKRGGNTSSVAFIDIDHYKAVNDRYGHQTGDLVLKKFASLLSDNIRKCDSVYRYGGEEFIILLPNTAETKACEVVERLKERIGRSSIEVEESKISITFSAGITHINGPEDTANELISRADRAMYHAKKSGRNKVVAYGKGIEEKEIKKTLLLVDDENAMVKMLKERLEQIGYNAAVAVNGEDAIKIAAKLQPDMMILDLNLPDIDGFEVCRRIKDDVATAFIKVIILSEKKEKEAIAKGLYAGADDYVTKPFSMIELEARIMRSLRD